MLINSGSVMMALFDDVDDVELFEEQVDEPADDGSMLTTPTSFLTVMFGGQTFALANKSCGFWPSKYPNNDPSPFLYSDASISGVSSLLSNELRPLPLPSSFKSSGLRPLSAPDALPVRSAICASIWRRADCTLSGRPVTSNTGSLSRDGVTIYVCVCCWMCLMVAPLGPTTKPTTRYGTRTWIVIWPGKWAGGPAGVPLPETPLIDGLRDARIKLKCWAAEMISRFAFETSSLRPVTTNTGSSPRTGVLMYVLVFALNALILQPANRKWKCC